MKKHLFFILFFVTVVLAFVSCDLKAVMSPSIRTASQAIRTDTAGIKDTIFLSDSLHIGDTVRLSVILDGYYDYLTAFGLSVDTVNVSAAVEWSDEYKYVLAEDADPEHGKITFLPDKVYGCYTTIRYIPLHSGTFRIDMKLVSAAQAPYSTMQNYFFIAVK